MRWPLALADPTTGSVPTRLRKLWRGLTAWGLAAALAGSALGASAPIHIGVLAVLDDEDTLQVWQPLADGLEQALPGRTVRLHALDAAALEAALQQGTLDFVVTNPGHYVLLEARHGATRLAMQSDEPPSILRERVTSKGGTTAAALERLELRGVGAAIGEAVVAARDRARAMADEFGSAG